ncbi:MAG: hypothetical protein K6A69_08555 [Lachnospiraceae bacterium]|nr:hypothetical protein [Lachnospiraceae bacterium]
MERKKTGFIILTVSVILIVLGLMAGEYREVWNKAVMICMECIGLG